MTVNSFQNTVHRPATKIVGVTEMFDIFHQSTCFRPPSQLSKTAQALASRNNYGKTVVVSFLSAISK